MNEVIDEPLYKIVYVWQHDSQRVGYHTDLLHYAFEGIVYSGKGYAKLVRRKIESLKEEGYKVVLGQTPFACIRAELSLKNKKVLGYLEDVNDEESVFKKFGA